MTATNTAAPTFPRTSIGDAQRMVWQNECRLRDLLNDLADRTSRLATATPATLAATLREISEASARAAEMAASIEAQRQIICMVA
jgi:hypothetical protein